MAVPKEIPVTIPVEAPTVATKALLLVHVPPVTELCNVVVPPTHVVVMPVIGATGLTVMVSVAEQPAPEVYFMTDVPASIPETTPVVVPIVATVVLLLLHVPPVMASLSVTVLPWHTEEGPVMATGGGRTVTEKADVQPVSDV